MTRLDDTEGGRHPDSELTPGRKPRLVTLGGALPQRHAPSAGAEYVTTLAEELAKLFEVTAFAPAHAANLEALDEGRCIVPSQVVGPRRPSTGWRILTRTDRVIRQLDLALPPLDMVWSLLVPGPTRSAVREADVVDLQWTEFISLAPLIRRLNPGAKLLGTIHDAMTQVAERSSGAIGRKARLRSVRRGLTGFHEGHSARAVDSLMVLSRKDGHIVSGLPGAVLEPQVVHPPRPDAHREHHEHSPAALPEVLFVGAFGRAANQDAVVWLLTEVWPRVSRSRPDARLVLAGSDPDGFAAGAAADRPDVCATGFVEDLSPYYSRASVVVVPLRVGAGVKFKTIDALLHAVPVVTTTIGSEGIDGSDLYWVEADGADSFGEGIVSALADPSARLRAQRAAEQVRDRYSPGAFANSVQRIYGKLSR